MADETKLCKDCKWCRPYLAPHSPGCEPSVSWYGSTCQHPNAPVYNRGMRSPVTGGSLEYTVRDCAILRNDYWRDCGQYEERPTYTPLPPRPSIFQRIKRWFG